jgi:sugar lactone lactonase YvrE
MRARLIPLFTALILVACKTSKPPRGGDSTAAALPESAKPVVIVSGFNQPEAVRYDPDQDVYFVGNWGNGEPDAKDNNGYISRMTPEGVVQNARFIAGGVHGATLNAPRGMYIVGDTLWVVDADAVRGFDRRTGAPLVTADFSTYKLGFLNDVAAGGDGEYVTDTGTNTIYRIAGGRVTVEIKDTALNGPNGITWDVAHGRFIVVPYGGDSVIRAWTPGTTALPIAGVGTSNKYDGVEVLPGGRILVSSQGDSSLHLFSGLEDKPIIKTGGAPADIAVDTKRNRTAVPFVDRSVVEIWQIPSESH